jgi:hypothetical protein
MTTARRPPIDHTKAYLARCAANDMRPRDDRGRTDYEAEVEAVAAQLLVACVARCEGYLGESASRLVTDAFVLAETFVDECHNRRAE